MGKYEEALKRARQGKPIDEVFPELKESEDERIRKDIMNVVKRAHEFYHPDDIDKWLDWLEKNLEYLKPKQEPEVELKPIWHNVAEEVPTEIGAEVVVACRNKNKECGIWLYDLIQCWEGEWKPRVNWEKPIRWAYVRDLDNARKKK